MSDCLQCGRDCQGDDLFCSPVCDAGVAPAAEWHRMNDELIRLRAQLAELQRRFSVTSEIWIVSVNPKRHVESWAVFQTEERARACNEALHGGEGTVEKRIVTGRTSE